MQSLQTWFAGSAPDKEPQGSSLLSEWNKYSSGGAGGSSSAAPATTAAPASSAQLISVEEGGAPVATGASGASSRRCTPQAALPAALQATCEVAVQGCATGQLA